MAPSDTNNDYKVRSFLYLHSGFGYNSLGSTCTCHYLIVGSNVFFFLNGDGDPDLPSGDGNYRCGGE